jgi:phage baseplate assembly protein W
MALYTDYTSVNETVTDAKAINNAIKNILFTPKGSMPGKPTFGSDLFKLIFSPLDHITKDLAKRYIREALRDWEKRIVIRKIDIKDIPEYNRLIINLEYVYRDKGLDVNEQISLTLAQ